MYKNKLMGVGGILLALVCLGFIVGFLRSVVIASSFGAGSVTDAYFVVYSSLMFIAVLMGDLIKVSFIPVFAEAKEVKGTEYAWYVANNMRNIIFVGVAFIVLIFMGLGDRIIPLIVPGFSRENLGLTIYFVRLMSPALIFLVFGSFLSGLFNSYKKFIMPAFSVLMANIIFVLIILLFKKHIKIYSLVVAFMVFSFIPVVVQHNRLKRLHDYIRFRLFIDLKEPYTRRILILMLPIFITIVLNQVLRGVEFWLCSNIADGVISSLSYARPVFMIPTTIFLYVVFTILLPKMSQQTALGREDDFIRTFDKEMKLAVTFFLPFMALFFTLSLPIVRLVYERGEFTVNDSMMAAKMLRYLAIGLAGTGISIVMKQAFAANKDTKTIAKVTIPIICFNVILDILLVKKYSYIGVPLGFAVCQNLTAFFLFFTLKYRYRKIDVKYFLIHSMKVAALTAAVGAGLWLVLKTCVTGS